MKITIKIPKPCHEDWSKMTPTQKGVYCSNCKKEVINYQYFSNDQLVKSLNEGEKFCGLFTPNQIDKELHSYEIKRNQSIGLLMSFTSLFLTTPVFSQNEKSKTEITENKLTSQQVEMNSTEFIELSGKVLEKLNTNEKYASLPGVAIVQKGTDNKVASILMEILPSKSLLKILKIGYYFYLFILEWRPEKSKFIKLIKI